MRFIALLLGLTALQAAAQEPLWIRYPALSPDGTTIAFSYQGDLYTVPATGGQALPLTRYDGHDTRPVWSRDGRTLAFASDRAGNFDVYVMPAEGGPATRLTYHSADDHPTDFAPDGGHVLFTSGRTDAPSNAQFPSGSLPELYRVSTEGGRVAQVLSLPAEHARYSPDGTQILYQDRKGYEDPWRKHHTSAVTRDLWLFTPADSTFEQVTTFGGEDREPVFLPDGSGMVYLSETDGTLDVHRLAFDGGAPEQLTTFDLHPVRFLSVAEDGTMAYTFDGRLYTQRPGGEPAPVPMQVRMDTAEEAELALSISGEADEMAVAPSGKEVAFVVRGEVYVASTEHGTTKRITHTPEQERTVSFSPDGRSLLYAGERDGSWNLYRTDLTREEEPYFFASTVLEETPVLVTDAETFQPAFSPDGKEVAFIEDRTTLRVLNLASGEARTILPGTRSFSYADGDQHYAWSPDGQWFFVEFIQPGYWMSEVGLVRADGTGEVVNLTESGYPDYRPQWMMGGKMLLWFSSRDGLRSQASTGGTEADAYALFLTREAYDRFRLSEEEFALLKEREAKAKKEAGEEKDEDDEAEDDETPEPLTIELDDVRDRKARLTLFSSRLSDAVVTPDGEKLVFLARTDETYDLWMTELRTKETKVLTSLGPRGGSLTLADDGKAVFVLSGGTIQKVTLEGGKSEPVAYSGTLTLDPAAERAYLFEHVWRQAREKFYAPDLHGAPWDTLKVAYARYLPHVTNGYDFADLLGELLGELNASHTGARYRHQAEHADATASLGALFDPDHTGDGLRITEVLAKGPLVYDGSRIQPGTVIEAIDGTPITATTNVARLLNRKAGQPTLLALHDPATDARWTATVEPITQGAEQALLYDRWVEQRRQLVEERSGGRLGYVHVRSMSDPSYRDVFEEVMGRQVTKEGLVVDTRFNGGGDLVDDLSTFLSGEPYMTFTTRDGRRIGGEPMRKWSKPSVVVAGAGNYSDAHCFPYAFQALGIGPVVGMPVPGTCTFVWWERLQDERLVFGIPNLAVRDVDGDPLENKQLEPDVRVMNEPAALLQGRDQQLERAVEVLLDRLGTE